MTKLKNNLLLFLIAFVSIVSLYATDYSPGQLLFKTSQSINVKNGRTGLTAFDSYLNNLQAQSIKPISKRNDNRWYSVNINLQPDWESVKSNSISFNGIEVIQPNYLNKMHVIPNDPWYSLQQMDLVQLPQAWNYSTGSSMVIVGVVDSGILKDHPDLAANIFYNPDEIPDNGIDDDNNGYIDDYCGWDFADAPEMSDVALGDYIDQDNDVEDENFHGTHVAGILGAVTNNGIGISGVCWNVKILSMRAGFRTTSGTGFLQDDDAAAAIIYATDMGVSVMNLSWGDENYSPVIADACNYAYTKGVTLVASAGNDPGPYLSYPARLASVISVGAVDQYKNLAGFSSYGPELDLVAPGQQIYSTYKLEGADMYKEQSGTSMSSPFVAGSAALLKSILPNLSPDEVRAKLLTSTDDLGDSGFDQKYGHGLLNVRKLLQNTDSPLVEINFPTDNYGISTDFDIIGTVECKDFFRYSVMCAYETNTVNLTWMDVFNNTSVPQWYYNPVDNGVIARFIIPELMKEGAYKLRIQYEDNKGNLFNTFMSIFIDQTAPILRPNTFEIFKRYDGQNVKFYAGALFNEPVFAELVIYGNNQLPISCYPSKRDSIQVWQLPLTIPQGYIDVEIVAINNSNLTYHSQVIPNAALISYEIITDYGFESRLIGNPMVPLNKLVDLDYNGIPEIMAMDLPSSGYGEDKFYELTDSLYMVKHIYPTRFWPLDLGDTNGAGMELLALNLDTANLYETTGTHTYPDSLIWSETGISGGIFADYNADGVKDILLVKNLPQERVIQLYKRIDQNHVSAPKVILKNKSQTSQRNMFIPTIICQNFDNDSRPDILTADTDGDIMIYEVYRALVDTAGLSWSHRLPVSNTYYMTSGDYDGNGTMDFFVGGYNKDVLDPNQTYWFFEGFKSTGDNNYVSMGHIQFNQVLAQNAIQSFDIDNDGKQEVILSISPNLYILKHTGNSFKPIFCGNSMRTYQIAAWTQNDQPYFMTNNTDFSDSLKAYEWYKQQPFTGPPTPANLSVIPISEKIVEITWQSNNAESYRLYRQESGMPAMLLAEIAYPAFVDTTVFQGRRYKYCVSAISSTLSPSESIKTRWIEVIPMPQPQINEITMIGANELRLVFDQPLATTSLNPGCYRVDHNIGVPMSVNSVLNQYGVQLRFRNTFTEIDGFYLVKLQNVFGLTGVAPIQTLFSFSYNPDYVPPHIEKAVVRHNKYIVDLTMSETIDSTSATDISNYRLVLPANDATNYIQSISVNDNEISITLAHKIRYSNQPYYLILKNIQDLSGNKITLNQNTCRFTLSDITNLSKVVVYPNPIKAKESEGINFLNFPQNKKGKLTIFNTAGDLIFQTKIGPFNQDANNVTYKWNLKNQAGKQVSSGIYFYVINMGDDSKKGKIAILN